MEFKNNGRNAVVYNSVFGNKEELLRDIIEPNPDTVSTSYKIKGESENACEIIKTFYEIKNADLFDKQYQKAVSGDGNEEKRILTLHSSSRLALLTFYNVDEEHTIILNVNGENIEFDFSTFEFKNPVINNPSNMDVVLVSKDRKKVLFLESKFSEYYTSAKNHSNTISKKYLYNKYSEYFYNEEWLKTLDIERLPHPEGFDLKMTNNKSNYLDGFKQMISHYVGIRQRLDEKTRIKSDEKPDNKKIADIILSVVEDPKSVVYLGEILFDGFYFPKKSRVKLDPQDVLNDYTELYSKLAQRMNEHIFKDGLADRFKVLEEDMTYSDVFTQLDIDPKIKEFYLV